MDIVNELRVAGHSSEAESACRQFLAADPENPDALWLMGALCYESGRGDEAMVMLGRAINAARAAGRVPPLDWSLALGAVQQQQGAGEDALRTFSDAVAEHPNSADARFCLA
ncbi:MAG: tetratricopeptide repeat protein, partial [Alphaproteobacteria bacterium]|nr:tetratricopeptide repeat protein [Alphaproteobacteria bacterium]